MAEWSKAAASKAVIPSNFGIVGSNPTLSSIFIPKRSLEIAMVMYSALDIKAT